MFSITVSRLRSSLEFFRDLFSPK